MNPPLHSRLPRAISLLIALVFSSSATLLANGPEESALPSEILQPTRVEPISRLQFEQLLEHHRGKVVLVNLWATWCVPCIQELPELSLLQARYRDKGLVVLAVSLDDPALLAERVRPFFAEKAPDLVSYLNNEEDSFSFVEPIDPDWLGALPTSFFFDRAGALRKTATGRLTYQSFESEVLTLLTGPQ